jgi:2,4-dienoyl-CoA reductase (NADPH2)
MKTDEALTEARDWVLGRLPPEDAAALFEPLRVGGVTIPNRFAMSAMGTRFGTEDGFITERHLKYYARRARGGVGAVIVEGSSVHPSGTTYLGKPRLYDNCYIPGFTRLATAIRLAGAVPGVQLMHSGRHAAAPARVGPALSVSGGGSFVNEAGSQPISEEEISTVIGAFASAAARAYYAGFRLLEVHAAHGYLIHDFLSPAFNHREDAWNGDARARARFLSEVVRAVKAAVGSDAGIMVRLSSSEFMEGGITPTDAVISARVAEEAGAELILVSGGNNENLEWIVPTVFMPTATYLEDARLVRQAISIPVGVVGRISTPQLAARAVVSGAADLAVLGRALLADPDFVAKIRLGDVRPIRPCIACNECLAQHIRNQPILCTVNPTAGREAEEPTITSTSTRRRRIAVVGAGPAGLLFAALAAGRGHQVKLLERQARPGGKLWLAAAAPYKTREMLALLTSLEAEAASAGVQLLVNAGDVAQGIREWNADLVVVASGATPDPGGDIVREPGAGFMLAEDYLAADSAPHWPRVAIIGAGDTACDAAARLAEAGSQVWLLARGNRIARGLEPVSSRAFRRYLKSLGVQILLGVQVATLGQGRLDYLDQDGSTYSMTVDQVLYSRGVQPSGERVLSELVALGVENVTIGDATDPGNFLTSMRSAWDLALKI